MVSKKCAFHLTDRPPGKRLLSRPQTPDSLTSYQTPPQLEATEQDPATDAGNAKTSKRSGEVRLAAIDLNDRSSGKRLHLRPQTPNPPLIEHCWCSAPQNRRPPPTPETRTGSRAWSGKQGQRRYEVSVRTEKEHGDMDAGVDACKGQRRPAVSTVRELVGHDINAPKQSLKQYKRYKQTFTIAERKKQLRALDRKLRTRLDAWRLTERHGLQELYTSVHTANSWQGRRTQFDLRKTVRRRLGTDRAVCCTRTLKKSWQGIVHTVT